MANKKDGNQNTNEKLSDEEFKKLIPHLDLNQLFLIELEKQGKWKNLYDVDDKIKEIHCTVCSLKILSTDFKEHIEEKAHSDALNKVEKVYHPLFTASRGSKLDFNEAEIELKTRKAKTIAAAIEEVLQRKYSKMPMYMPLEDLLSVEVQTKKDGKWQKLLKPEGPATEKSKYYCILCSRYCAGIITVDAHLRGQAHRILQCKVFAMRAEHYTAVNKYSLLSYRRKKEQENNTDQEGLIGVEYVARIKKPNRKISYACCLCHPNNIFPTEEWMEDHLISLKHRLRYCEEHYTDTTKHFEDMVSSSGLGYDTGMAFVLSKMAEGIEKYHGYGKPHAITYADFIKDKKYIVDLVAGMPHACQEFGPSFSTVVNINDLNALRDKPNLYTRYVKTVRARFTKPLHGKHYLNMFKHVSRVVQAQRDSELRSHRSVSSTSSGPRVSAEPIHVRRTHSTQGSMPRSNSPLQLLQRARKRRLSPLCEGNDEVWRAYRHQLSESASDLEQAFLEYRTHPEKHPDYDKEWSDFWKRRKTQLQEQGIDYRSYDFQPEWTTYFRQRLEQLFSEHLEGIKIDIRRQLNIPLEVEEDSGFSHGVGHYAAEPPRKREFNLSEPLRRRELNFIETTHRREFNSSELPRMRELNSAETPHQRDFNSSEPHRRGEFNSIETPNQREFSSSEPQRQRLLYSAESLDDTKMWNPPVAMEHEKPNIIGLLRLMTALEDHLGSTGDKILDLLTKALSLEKMYSSDSSKVEERILNANNCRLIKTAQEKLKSQLYADLVESKKINSFNRVIESAEVLLQRADAMGWSRVEEPVTATAPTQNLQIEKLIEVLQEKTKRDFNAAPPAVKKKTLPDTLMELMNQQQNNTLSPMIDMKSSGQIEQSNYGMYGHTSAVGGKTNSTSLTQQNHQFLQQTAGAANQNFLTSVHNTDVWNRLGGQANYPQRNSQNFMDNYGGHNPNNPAGTNVLGDTTYPYGGPSVNESTNNYSGSSTKRHPFGF